MKLKRVASILGLILYVLAAAELVPLLGCLLPFDQTSLVSFLISAAACGGTGFALRLFGNEDGELYRREGILIVVGAWFLASAMGAIPYLVSGAIPGVIDALFESASGFTTTGASILLDIEAVPRPILFWRSMTQWLGGIGIVVLFVALLSELGPGARFLFKLEVPGPKAEILHARVKQTAMALFRIYLALTVTQTLLMWALGAGFYDAMVHTFSTVSTGGFSPYADSMGHFSDLLQAVVLVFMLLSGINFGLYHALSIRRDLSVLRDLELRTYLGLIGGGLGGDLHRPARDGIDGFAALRAAGFSVPGRLAAHHHRIRHGRFLDLAGAIPRGARAPDVHRGLCRLDRRRGQDHSPAAGLEGRAAGGADDVQPELRDRRLRRRSCRPRRIASRGRRPAPPVGGCLGPRGPASFGRRA